MVNSDVKIPEKHYVTFQKRDGDDIPLAFMTPFGTDSAAKKRIGTADHWAAGWGKSTPDIPSRTINNEPMTGFKLRKNIQRYSTSNVVWRIQDPRGFELEITSGNLSDLLQACIIENGEILAPCAWARLKANNVLVPESSEEYQAAIANTQRINKKVSMRDVKIGNKILLHSGEEAVYMGSFYSISLVNIPIESESSNRFTHRSDHHKQKEFKVSPKKKHIFYIEKNGEGWRSGPSYKGIASPKISEILETDTIELAEAERIINEKYMALEAQIVDGRGDTEYYVCGVIADSVEISNVNIISIDNVKEYFEKKKEHSDLHDIYWTGQYVIAETNTGSYYISHRQSIGSGHSYDSGFYDFDLLKLPRLLDEKIIDSQNIDKPRHQYHRIWNSSPTPPTPPTPPKNESLFEVDEVKWYYITIKLKNEKTNNEVELIV